MALGIGYGLPFVAQHGTNPYKTQWAAALEGAKGAGASVEDENAGTGSCLVSRGQDVYTDGLPFTPSLLIVPQFYKAGNLYQDVPPFVAEDTTMRFTVSRNTTATRVDSSGLIESVASGVPRIDWLGQSCPALLVEASGSNLALQSENFGTTWSPQGLLAFGSGSVLNTTATLDPYGTNVADLIVANTTVSQHRIDQAPTSVSGSYTFSAFVKAAGYSFTKLRIGLDGTIFDLSSGVVVANDTGITSSIQSFGNGWYRCIIGKAASAANETIRINMQPTSSTADFAGNGTSGIYVFGAQYETGSIATTYIPTTAAAVSRAADVISASGALVSGLIGQTEGTIYAEVDIRNMAKETYTLEVDDGVNANRIIIRSLTSNQMRGSIVATTSSGTIGISSATFTSGIVKIAFAYKSGDFALSVNGAAALTASGTFTFGASLNRITLGSVGGGGIQLNDRIRAAALYTTRLSNDQLAELTRL